jgi:superfamily I DNA/RNA helicase
MFTKLAAGLAESKNPPFDFAVVDEAQDLGVAHLRFLASLGRRRQDALFFTGDLGQRIFQQPFSWLALGVDIRGQSRTLRVNYRTSHQIRMQADRLLGPEVSDADGNTEKRSHTVSVFNGPVPQILVLDTKAEELVRVSQWVSARAKEGVAAHEFGIFVRSAAELDRARSAAQQSGIPFKVLDENVETTSGFVCISTMHLAKGLEFRAVVVMACDDEVIPSQQRIEAVADEADLEDVYNTTFALCGLHTSEGSSACDERGSGVGVSRRSANVMRTRSRSSRGDSARRVARRTAVALVAPHDAPMPDASSRKSIVALWPSPTASRSVRLMVCARAPSTRPV